MQRERSPRRRHARIASTIAACLASGCAQVVIPVVRADADRDAGFEDARIDAFDVSTAHDTASPCPDGWGVCAPSMIERRVAWTLPIGNVWRPPLWRADRYIVAFTSTLEAPHADVMVTTFDTLARELGPRVRVTDNGVLSAMRPTSTGDVAILWGASANDTFLDVFDETGALTQHEPAPALAYDFATMGGQDFYAAFDDTSDCFILRRNAGSDTVRFDLGTLPSGVSGPRLFPIAPNLAAVGLDANRCIVAQWITPSLTRLGTTPTTQCLPESADTTRWPALEIQDVLPLGVGLAAIYDAIHSDDSGIATIQWGMWLTSPDPRSVNVVVPLPCVNPNGPRLSALARDDAQEIYLTWGHYDLGTGRWVELLDAYGTDGRQVGSGAHSWSDGSRVYPLLVATSDGVRSLSFEPMNGTPAMESWLGAPCLP